MCMGILAASMFTTMCVCSASEEQKRVSDPLGLKLQVICLVGAKN